jgi:hypothetical protein
MNVPARGGVNLASNESRGATTGDSFAGVPLKPAMPSK